MSKLYIVTLLFNLYAEYIMRNAGLDEAQAGIKIAGEMSITLDMQKTRVQFFGQEDPLEEKMATDSSILARKLLWTEEPGGL